ncbi:MAG: protein-methionine-sulfoxide reductase heme-binding subunit MsrQ [Rhodobacter sp.]|nr:protein-methionine-sulfoxide reductase heme-binding subunit MsrQ [Rhodobacter sp.]MCA3458555.1 protein-methionine-sulfoxide reductase heme-binding subunit MsrQ [Rhodobacter sp.]MCA3461822.1 protein-methionine-sulfoxide reductase heme-binding subunit MsrQ [Rhodobacter sp.]MCA3465299.1 protein-methionine-sulfoxide reductase heme-binding subunit MsrQ [Rhodobacter sp.]MCA3467360.1 protein-methionine-sulfoxide reductase heme-binding subunit MsrQ [Rhodobacter sp.]
MDGAASLNGALRRVPVWAVCGLGLVPLAVLVWRGLSGGLGIDPVKTLEHQLGLTALQLLLAGLVVTPLRRWTGVNLIRYRRAIGLLAFLYAALHLLVWLWLDLQLRWSEIGADLVKRPYVIVGMLGFACLVPLAMTSNGWSVRRLGAAAWQRLHRLAYAAVLLAALHYLLLVKVWSAEPLLYALAAAGLVALRWLWRRGRSGTVRA